MTIDSFTEKLLAYPRGAPLKLPSEADYAVRMFFPTALRYYEAGKTVTVFIEPTIDHGIYSDLARLLLRQLPTGTSIEAFLEEPIVWDNTQEQPTTPEGLIQHRIDAALKAFGLTYKLTRIPPRRVEP